FCDDDIRKLQLLSKAVESGHSISQIASLSQEELIRVVEDRSFETRYRIDNGDLAATKTEPYLNESLQCVAELDINKLQGILDRAAIDLTRPLLILNVVIPLLIRTKCLVQNNNLRPINLKAVTSYLQAFMWGLLRSTTVSESAPKILTGTLTGQCSEIAALAMALIAVESGYKAVHLGSNLAASDLAAAGKSKAAQAVAIFFEDNKDKCILGPEIRILQEKLGKDQIVIVCAYKDSDTRKPAKHTGISLTSLDDFRSVLETLTTEKMMLQI
ncbi:MAG: hypothetical protein PVJ77_06930, partial [Desulfobacterales bacterium]